MIKKGNILVTGGCGFIGSHLVDSLLEKGYSVSVLDNLSTGKLENIPIGHPLLKFYHGCITEPLTVKKILTDINVVVHLAAISSVQASFDNMQLSHKVNFDGTLNLLESARFNGVKRFVFASSAAIYGEINQLPLAEDLSPCPLNSYACDKLLCEYYLKLYQKHFDFNTTVFRLFNVYGPRQNNSSGYSGVISTFITNALLDMTLKVFGDGKQSRDFIYVKDVAEIFAASLFTSELNGQIINVGTGRRTSLLEIINTLERILSKKIQVYYLSKRHGDIRHSQANIDKLKLYFKINNLTSLEEGLEKNIRNFKVV